MGVNVTGRGDSPCPWQSCHSDVIPGLSAVSGLADVAYNAERRWRGVHGPALGARFVAPDAEA